MLKGKDSQPRDGPDVEISRPIGAELTRDYLPTPQALSWRKRKCAREQRF
jgi:hypothetical protein